MVNDNDNRQRQKIVNEEDIKRILIDRDIVTIKQAFYRNFVLYISLKDSPAGLLQPLKGASN